MSSLSMASTAKIDRKLYVGNLPTSITQRMLIDRMNEAMISLDKKEGWNLEPGLPIVSSWISTDGHYGFIEFRTAEEAQKGFSLQGMSFLGSQLKIGRPKAYQDPDGENASNDGHGLEEFNPILAATQGISNPIIGGEAKAKLFTVIGPTRVLQLKDIVTFELASRFDKCQELYTDIMKKCENYGTI